MRNTPESLPEIPRVDIPFVFRENIAQAIETSYLKPKGEPERRPTKRRVNRLIKSVTETAIEAAEKGKGLEYLEQSLPRTYWGLIAEIFAVWACRSAFSEEFAVSPSSFKRDFAPGVDFRFRQRETGRRLFFDLYIGTSPRLFVKKASHVHKIRDGFILPLCLHQDPRLPDSINRILKGYPGIEFGKLKKPLAIQVWHAAQEGRFALKILPWEWNEAVKNRVLAGYLIRLAADKKTEKVSSFEEMIAAVESQKA